MNSIDLKAYGFHNFFKEQADRFKGLSAGRVLSQSQTLYRVIAQSGELSASVSGRFRYEARSAADFPAVGDFVMMEECGDGSARIRHVLPRTSAFVRRAAGTGERQVAASNIDTVFLCMALNQDFNLRRLERYLAAAWDSGAVPVAVLTKADLCGDLTERLLEVSGSAPGVDILITSSLSEDPVPALLPYLGPGRTAAFLGSSGVGKSTLINRLLGEERLETNGLRNDGRGRHTTTRRELFLLKSGGIVIDTPGMRELGLEDADFSRSFSDISALASRCRFRDCSHGSEPGCAVKAAVQDGRLSQERLDSYRKLLRETAYSGLTARQLEETKLNGMFREIGGMKKAKRALKERDKRRL